MFERFTERARQVVVLAQDEARKLRHNYIGTEHILLGLLREEEGLAARVLESFDVTADGVRARVVELIGEGDEATTGQIPFTPRAKKALELALREALRLGHNYIGTEHLLLGLVRLQGGVGVEILRGFGADEAKVTNEVTRMLSGPGRRGQPTSPTDLPSLEWGPVTVSPSSARPRSRRSQLQLLVAGWLLFGVPVGVGVLVGWLIWG